MLAFDDSSLARIACSLRNFDHEILEGVIIHNLHGRCLVMILNWPETGLGECLDVVVGTVFPDFAITELVRGCEGFLEGIEETCNQKPLQFALSAIDGTFLAVSIRISFH